MQSYLSHQIEVVSEALTGCRTVLDFGCGDMAMDRILCSRYPNMKITGVDVCAFHPNCSSRMQFVRYDGTHLPFPKRSFDAVIAYHVFHHCPVPQHAFAECMRVVKKRIIIVEPVIRNRIDRIGFIIMDVLTNEWKKEGIPMPFTVQTLPWWQDVFRKHNVHNVTTTDVSVWPSFLPIGVTKRFVVTV